MNTTKEVKVTESDTEVQGHPGKVYRFDIAWTVNFDNMNPKTTREVNKLLDKIRAEISAAVSDTLNIISKTAEERFIKHFDGVHVNKNMG